MSLNLGEYAPILDMAVVFVAGLFIGLGVKKGIMAFLFTVIGFLLASYVGIAFLPKVSPSGIISKALAFAIQYESQVKFGAVAVTLTVVIFLIGLVMGLWKG